MLAEITLSLTAAMHTLLHVCSGVQVGIHHLEPLRGNESHSQQVHLLEAVLSMTSAMLPLPDDLEVRFPSAGFQLQDVALRGLCIP